MRQSLINIKNFVKDNFGFVLIAMLVIIIMLQNCERTIEIEKPTVKIDTVFVPIKGEVKTVPPIIHTIQGKKEIQYVPDPSYERLVVQYNKLVQEHTEKNISIDSIKINQNGVTGFMRIEDTINKNKIIGRNTSYSLTYPKITTTIIEPTPKRNEIYIGGGLQGGDKIMINAATAGLLWKTRNDKIYGLYGGMSVDGTAVVGVQAYWKISIKK